ncbi:MAG TPA: ABC transporter permease subunit [Rhizomicrobium sp.]|jgi:oligopeptide transport system permease protein|nr:ABC transporter permease subunit [Rhizomicrobium sp.]
MVMPFTIDADKEQIMERALDVRGRSLWVDARRRLIANKAAVISMIVLGIVALMAIFAPMLSPYAYDSIDYNVVSCSPDWWPDATVMCNAGGAHWFGTDAIGRDLFVRTLYGARVSLAVGLLASFVSLFIGVTYGATAGFIGGRIDELMMRFVDVLYSLPFIFFVIILMVVFNRNFFLLFLAIGAVEWLTMARIVRGQTLSLRNKEFIEAARASGASTQSIIARHIIPNVVGPVIVYVTLTIPAVILAESFLSFLGLGIQEPLTSWGVLIYEGANQMEVAPWMLVFPALFMSLTLFCLNFIGDGLRDALDPKDR